MSFTHHEIRNLIGAAVLEIAVAQAGETGGSLLWASRFFQSLPGHLEGLDFQHVASISKIFFKKISIVSF